MSTTPQTYILKAPAIAGAFYFFNHLTIGLNHRYLARLSFEKLP
ncbi:hypothetical protein EV14_2522 [Prochlorococcus sp. MIT 0703]|nr:hypothetical protein [Prochlorococcus sp. MIT 0702]KGG31151.1 hypothetical protein EV14_2522 [Prochlorococcus sp. MIT 0703]